ncbi:MAG: hypothetical protein P8X89_13240 [Reinekea sp.]
MLPKNQGESAIFETQIEIKLLHPASTEEVTDSGLINQTIVFGCSHTS